MIDGRFLGAQGDEFVCDVGWEMRMKKNASVLKGIFVALATSFDIQAED